MSNETTFRLMAQDECIAMFKKLFKYNKEQSCYETKISFELIQFLKKIQQDVLNYYWDDGFGYDPVPHYFDDDLMYEIDEAVERLIEDNYKPTTFPLPQFLNKRNIKTMKLMKLFIYRKAKGYKVSSTLESRAFYSKYYSLI